MRTYTTERGVKIRIAAIPLLLDAIREAHQHPEPPAYTENVSGEMVEVEMTPEDMAAAKEHNPEWYEEHRAVWEAYQAKYRRSAEALNEKTFDAAVLEAVQIDMPEGDGWIKRLARFGVTVGEDEDDRRIAYVRNMVIGGPKDILAVSAIASGADVTEDDLARAEASFRPYIQRLVLEGVARETGAMAGEKQPVPGAPDSSTVGDSAE